MKHKIVLMYKYLHALKSRFGQGIPRPPKTNEQNLKDKHVTVKNKTSRESIHPNGQCLKIGKQNVITFVSINNVFYCSTPDNDLLGRIFLECNNEL